MNNIVNTVLDNLEKIEFGFFDYTTLTINILLLFLVHKVVIKLDPLGEELRDYKAKVKVIRLVSFLFLSTFLVFASLGKNIGANWSQSYILILSLYLINHWLNNFMMMKYGEKKERPIYGEANLDQTKELIEEDISVVPLPWTPAKKSN